LIFPKIDDEATVEYAARIISGVEDSEEDDDSDNDAND
jgi:hypothetical protein